MPKKYATIPASLTLSPALSLSVARLLRLLARPAHTLRILDMHIHVCECVIVYSTVLYSNFEHTIDLSAT